MKWKHEHTTKEKVSSTVVNKEGHTHSLMGHEWTHYYFLEKDATINSAFYHKILRQNLPCLLDNLYGENLADLSLAKKWCQLEHK